MVTLMLEVIGQYYEKDTTLEENVVASLSYLLLTVTLLIGLQWEVKCSGS